MISSDQEARENERKIKTQIHRPAKRLVDGEDSLENAEAGPCVLRADGGAGDPLQSVAAVYRAGDPAARGRARGDGGAAGNDPVLYRGAVCDAGP